MLINGDIGSNLGAFPVMGTIPVSPTAIPAGLFKRIAKQVSRIKTHAAYTLSIGHDLGIELNSLQKLAVQIKPVLTVKLNVGKPLLKWIKGQYSGIDIYVDRNDGKGMQFLATSVKNQYTDQTPLPAGTKVAQWDYCCIYKMGDTPTGDFSDNVSIAVVEKTS